MGPGDVLLVEEDRECIAVASADSIKTLVTMGRGDVLSIKLDTCT
jgi:hypothetical protein